MRINLRRAVYGLRDFVKRVKKEVEVGDERAWKKAGQALRECAPEIRVERQAQLHLLAGVPGRGRRDRGWVAATGGTQQERQQQKEEQQRQEEVGSGQSVRFVPSSHPIHTGGPQRATEPVLLPR